ncbi:M13 family metallopeptidase [Dyella sp. BiH032]|uniref:M13 family metallopeptidase n=1 Tax=Dyella sp. BiH032 TaxID=3075430 RepID=UPI002893775A|nr:M13 family metallopeptidase [Dyella sp. BiH032]WNL44264.1 M13 family metallopeptidase [Dyella sp. BiH032]
MPGLYHRFAVTVLKAGLLFPAWSMATEAVPFDTAELDRTISPCTDFDRFVNARWLAAHPIPPDEVRWGVFDQLTLESLHVQHDIAEQAAGATATANGDGVRRQIGLLYRSGMDVAAIERAGLTPLRPTLDAIARLKTSEDTAVFLAHAAAEGQPFVFAFDVQGDFRDARKQIAAAAPAALGLPNRDYYADVRYAQERKAYRAYMVRLFRLAGDGAPEQAADDALALETALAKVTLSPVEARQPANQFHAVRVAEADRLTPHFPWAPFLAAQGLSAQDEFSMAPPAFFAGFDRLLASAPPAQWRAYLRFHALDQAAPYLAQAFQDASFDFHGRTLTGQQNDKPRWQRVLGTMNAYMGEAMGQLYVARTFSPEAKQRAQVLVTRLLDALKARIEALDWMSQATKARALAKWRAFVPKVGYPDHWRDWSGLDLSATGYYANVRALARHEHRDAMARVGKPTDRSRWSVLPQTVDAFYRAEDNSITFPAAILQPPFFYADGDDAINYGGIGAAIGHEATHGFDDAGRQFDGQGNQTDWWTAEDNARFNARADALVRQFDAYAPLPDHPDVHINGRLTLGENIADLGGVYIAYDALQSALKANPDEAGRRIDGYTQDQRFFLAFARIWRAHMRERQTLVYLSSNPHATPRERIMGTLGNVPAFAKAFQCKTEDAMTRPADRQVRIW